MSTLNRIEQLVSAFESFAYLLRLRAQAITALIPGRKPTYDTGGPIDHFHSLREHIKEIGADITKFDLERFLPLRDGQIKAFGMFASIPTEIASWSTFSRRVYAPTLDAQTILSASKLDGITWAEVEWPFGSFAIELAEPIADPHGNVYDTVMVMREQPVSDAMLDNYSENVSEDQLERTERLFTERASQIELDIQTARERVGNSLVLIRLLGPTLEQAIVTKKEREKTSDLFSFAVTAQKALQKTPGNEHSQCVAKKAKYQFWKHLDELQKRVSGTVLPFFPISIERHGDLPVTQSVDALRKTMIACTCGKPTCFLNTDHPELDIAAQLVVGLTLYLRTAIRPEKPLVGSWEPLPLTGRIVHNSVTTDAVRCEVRASRPFTQDQRDKILGRGSYTRKWAEIAWTAGYNRRPIGQGHDPNAPRSVRIEAYPSLRWFSKEPGTDKERASAPIRLT